MKKYLLFFLLAAFQFSVNAQVKSSDKPFMTKSLSNESIKDVEVETSGGSISVSGVAATEARVEVYITSNNNKELTKEEIQQRLNEKYNLQSTISIEDKSDLIPQNGTGTIVKLRLPIKNAIV